MGSNANDMTYSAQTVSVSTFWPFGNLSAHRRMLSKNYENGYRFGFQGQERDDEVYGKGNSYTAEFWQYDPRLGRRWNNDPVIYAFQSYYVTFNNNPILYSDPSGAQPELNTDAEENDNPSTTYSIDKKGNITGYITEFTIIDKKPNFFRSLFSKIRNFFISLDKKLFGQSKSTQSGYIFTTEDANVATEDYGNPTEEIPIGPLKDILKKDILAKGATLIEPGTTKKIIFLTKAGENVIKINNQLSIKIRKYSNNTAQEIKVPAEIVREENILKASNQKIRDIKQVKNGYWVTVNNKTGTLREATPDEIEQLKIILEMKEIYLYPINKITIYILLGLSLISCVKTHKEYRKDGTLLFEGEIDENNLRNGWGKFYYPNGNLEQEGFYKNDKEEGLFKIYYETGELKQELNYKEGIPEGILKEYFKNGNIKLKCYFKNGKQEGKLIEYYQNGNIKSEQNFKKNIPHGIYKSYYLNGQINMEALYDNDSTYYYIIYDSLGNWIEESRFFDISISGDTLLLGKETTITFDLYGSIEDSVFVSMNFHYFSEPSKSSNPFSFYLKKNKYSLSFTPDIAGQWSYLGFYEIRDNGSIRKFDIPLTKFYVKEKQLK